MNTRMIIRAVVLFMIIPFLVEFAIAQRNISFRDKQGRTLKAEIDNKTGSARRIFGLNLDTRQYGYERSHLSSETMKYIGKRLIDDYEEVLRISSKNINLKKMETDGEWWFVEYEQTFAGIPVYSSEIGFTVDPQGSIITAGAFVFPDISVRTQASVSSVQALSIEKEEFGDESATLDNEPELFVLPIERETQYRYYLTWKIRLSSLKPLRDSVYFVSADDGSVVKRFSNIRHDVIYGTVKGNYYPQRSSDTPVRTAYPIIGIRMYNILETIAQTNADQNGNYSITYSVAYATYYLDFPLQSHLIQLRNANNNLIRHTFAFTPAASIRYDYEWVAGDAANVWYHGNRIHDFFPRCSIQLHWNGLSNEGYSRIGSGCECGSRRNQHFLRIASWSTMGSLKRCCLS